MGGLQCPNIDSETAPSNDDNAGSTDDSALEEDFLGTDDPAPDEETLSDDPAEKDGDSLDLFADPTPDEIALSAIFELSTADEKCSGYNGEPAEGCPSPESVSVSAGPDGNVVVEIRLVGASADAEVTIEFLANNSDELILVDCSEAQGCISFFGPGLENLDSPFLIESATTSDGSFVFTGVPLLVSGNDELLIDVPSGTTSSGIDVAGGPRIVDGVFVYSAETAGDPKTRLQGVSKYPTSRLASGLIDLDPDMFRQP